METEKKEGALHFEKLHQEGHVEDKHGLGSTWDYYHQARAEPDLLQGLTKSANGTLQTGILLWAQNDAPDSEEKPKKREESFQ